MIGDLIHGFFEPKVFWTKVLLTIDQVSIFHISCSLFKFLGQSDDEWHGWNCRQTPWQQRYHHAIVNYYSFQKLTWNGCKLVHFVVIHVKDTDPTCDGVVLCVAFLNALLNPVEKLVRIHVKFLCLLRSTFDQTTQVPFAKFKDPNWIVTKVPILLPSS